MPFPNPLCGWEKVRVPMALPLTVTWKTVFFMLPSKSCLFSPLKAILCHELLGHVRSEAGIMRTMPLITELALFPGTCPVEAIEEEQT